MTIAALLVAHSCNVGYTPVIGAADSLKYRRLSHVDQTYLRLATYRGNPPGPRPGDPAVGYLDPR